MLIYINRKSGWKIISDGPQASPEVSVISPTFHRLVSSQVLIFRHVCVIRSDRSHLLVRIFGLVLGFCHGFRLHFVFLHLLSTCG